MSRTAGDVPIGSGFPPVGKHVCTVLDVIAGTSARKKTPQIEITMSNGEMEFADQLYVTDKTLSRLCLFAIRVCGMPRGTALPDADSEAVSQVAKFIINNALGKKAVVIIEEKEEKFMPESGPDAGRMVTKKRRRVAFPCGYEEYKPAPAVDGDMQEPTAAEEPLPF
jgi:hypothetical protein